MGQPQNGYYKVSSLRKRRTFIPKQINPGSVLSKLKNNHLVGVNGESDDVSLGPKTHGEIMTNNMSLPDRESSITASLFLLTASLFMCSANSASKE